MAKKQMVKRPNMKKPAARTAASGLREVVSSYDKWIIWLTCAILITVPLLFSRISYDQFDLVKLAVFRVLVLGIVLVWVAKMLVKPEPINWSWREGLLAAFILVAVVSTLTSIHIPTALHGKYKRYEGLLTFITYVTAYFVVAQTFRNKSRARLVVEVISITGAIVALYGIMQYVGLDPVYWGEVPFEQRRSFSTFGNPDLLAGYLVLALSCSVVAFLDHNRRRWLHGAAWFTIGAGLLTAFTRSGWVGAISSSIVLFLLLNKRLKLYWRQIAAVSLALVVVLVGLFVYSSSSANLNLEAKVRGALALNQGTATSRFQIWKAGWLMVKDRPFFGQGLDTYRLASEHFETKTYVQGVAGTTVSDNAHNYFVQLAAGGGPIAALLLYGFFILWIVRMLLVRRKLVDETEYLLVTGALAGVIGYLTTMLFGISIVGAGSTFWVLMAAMTGLTWRVDPAYRSLDVSRKWQEVKLALAVAVVSITVVSAGFAVAMYVGDVYLVNALKAAAAGQESAAAADFNTAFALYPGNGRIMSEMGQAYTRWASGAAQQKDKKTFEYCNQKAIDSFSRASLAEPLEIDYRVFLANEYAYVGQRQRALEILDKVLEQRPYSVPGNLLKGQFLMEIGRKTEAVRYYENVLALVPSQKMALSAVAGYYNETGDTKKAAYYQKELDKLKGVSE